MKQSRDHLIQSLFENMNAIQRSMHAHKQKMHGEQPLSSSQLELLFTISFAQPVSSKQLANQLRLTPGAVSQLLENLEQQGFVERRTSEEDRRVQYLRVSTEGESLLRSLEKRRRKFMEAVIKDLSDEELEIWLQVQQKMAAYFKAEITE
jgi:DNA-binding MarR family transcriptional regulator